MSRTVQILGLATSTIIIKEVSGNFTKIIRIDVYEMSRSLQRTSYLPPTLVIGWDGVNLVKTFLC